MDQRYDALGFRFLPHEPTTMYSTINHLLPSAHFRHPGYTPHGWHLCAERMHHVDRTVPSTPELVRGQVRPTALSNIAHLILCGGCPSRQYMVHWQCFELWRMRCNERSNDERRWVNWKVTGSSIFVLLCKMSCEHKLGETNKTSLFCITIYYN